MFACMYVIYYTSVSIVCITIEYIHMFLLWGGAYELSANHRGEAASVVKARAE